MQKLRICEYLIQYAVMFTPGYFVANAFLYSQACVILFIGGVLVLLKF